MTDQNVSDNNLTKSTKGNSKADILQKLLNDLLNNATKQEFEKPTEQFLEFEKSTPIESQISTSINKGLTKDQVKKNLSEFGENDRVKFEETPCIEFFIEPLADIQIIILIIAAIVSVPVGLWENHWDIKGALEGVAILCAVCVVVLVTAQNNWAKEQEFKKLQEVYANSKKYQVMRNGLEEEVEFESLVVGDLIKLNYGTQVPVDVILVRYEGQTLKVDESSVTGESDLIEKCTVAEMLAGKNKTAEDNIKFCVLISGSTVNEGTAQGLVVTVGENTYIRQQTKLDANDESPLQEKLSYIAEQIGMFGSVAALSTVLVIVGKVVVIAFLDGDWDNVVSQCLKGLIIGVSVVVCAIPEGLPLAVTISLAYSVRKMMDDNNLVKKINSCETMGNADCICTDKTGTLTENLMTIMEFWSDGKKVNNIDAKTTLPFYEWFKRTVYYDCAINFREDDNNKGALECVGSKTEVACVNLFCSSEGMSEGNVQHYSKVNKFLELRSKKEELDKDIYMSAFKDDQEFVAQWPFNSKQKMSCALIKKGSEYQLMLKGAPDFLVHESMLQETAKGPSALDATVLKDIKLQLENWSEQCQRNIALCHYKVNFDPYEGGELLKNPFEKLDKSKQILQGLVGIQDPLRRTVADSIDKCKKAGITVRMITGDNKETAFAIAKKCGILDASIPKSDIEKQVISGQKFNELTGGTKEVFFGEGLDLVVDEFSIAETEEEKLEENKREALKLIKFGHKLEKKQFVKNLQWFKDHIADIRVMARSQPVDKFTMVTGLMQLEHIVAVTGDGANDASALSKSSVGFAMGIAGTQAAKEACDIVILDDDFTSIVKAVLWGRNVFDGVRKFLQFQLSVNVVAVLTTFISATFDKSSHSSLTAVQLLWVNMIMDSLGALALATDEPTDNLLNRKPQHKRERIINTRIFFSVGVMGLFQTVMICVFLQAGHLFLPCQEVAGDATTTLMNCLDGNIRLNGQVREHPQFDEVSEFNSQHQTLVFNLFIFMQVFNLLNCRKLESYNFFSGIHRNFIFIGIWVLIFAVQILLGNYGGVFFSVYRYGMSLTQWLIVIGISLIVIPLSLFTKYLIFNVFKLTDGENDLEEEEEEGAQQE